MLMLSVLFIVLLWSCPSHASLGDSGGEVVGSFWAKTELLGQCALVDGRNRRAYVDAAEAYMTENNDLIARIMIALEDEFLRQGYTTVGFKQLMRNMREEVTRMIKDQYRASPARFVAECPSVLRMFAARRFLFQPLEKLHPKAFAELRPYLY
jgi:hypothetical protein